MTVLGFSARRNETKCFASVYLDDDRLIETNLHVRQVQGTLPSALSSAVFHLVDLLEDVGVIESGAIGSFSSLSIEYFLPTNSF